MHAKKKNEGRRVRRKGKKKHRQPNKLSMEGARNIHTLTDSHTYAPACTTTRLIPSAAILVSPRARLHHRQACINETDVWHPNPTRIRHFTKLDEEPYVLKLSCAATYNSSDCLLCTNRTICAVCASGLLLNGGQRRLRFFGRLWFADWYLCALLYSTMPVRVR